MSALLSVLASAASFGTPPYAWVNPAVFSDMSRAVIASANVRAALLDPTTYVVVVGWCFAAALMSWFSGRATRIAAIAGAVLSAAVLAGTYALADQVGTILGQSSVWLTTELVASIAASTTMVVLIAALGAPVRPEGDGEPAGEPDDEPDDEPESEPA